MDICRRRSTCARAAVWRFILGGGSHRVAEPEAHRIDLEPDRPPRVDLVCARPIRSRSPARGASSWPGASTTTTGSAPSSWCGRRATRRRSGARSKPSRRPDRARLSGKIEWDLGEIDLKPGVRVAYHLEAKDNDTVPGPNVGRSKTLTLSMFSPREKQERAIDDEQELVEAAVQLLGDRLEVKHDGEEQIVEAFDAHALEGRGAACCCCRMPSSRRARRSRRRRSAPRTCAVLLGEMHARLGKLVREEEQTLDELRDERRKSRRFKAGAARPLEKGNPAHVSELERDVIALDDLVGKQRLEELLAVADEMAATRDRLKQLMAEYKKTHSAETKKEIERELRELERKLAELAQKAQRLASELPDQFLNKEAMGDNDLQKKLDQVRADDGARRHRSGDGRARQAVAVARQDDVVDGAGLEGLPRRSASAPRRRRWPRSRTSSPI